MTDRSLSKGLLEQLRDWYEDQAVSEREVYHICVGLAILELALERFPLERADYITPKSQVRTSGGKVKKILERYGEKRRLASEGGRTTRAALSAAEELVLGLNNWSRAGELVALDSARRREALGESQKWLVERATEFLNRQKLSVEVSLAKPVSMIVRDILKAAAERKQAGAVAQHLVGAKLALRYPDLAIENRSHTTADKPLERSGDFLVGDTIFHVTISPAQVLFEKVRQNLRDGYRAKVLVPEDCVVVAAHFASIAGLSGQVDVASLEGFVGQNIEEIAEFAKGRLDTEILALLNTYNTRVASVEADLSLQIEIPRNLGRREHD